MTAPFRLEMLGDAHDRRTFACGNDALDTYFRTQVSQDIRRHITNCFVAADCETDRVAGYYTLAAASIPLTGLPRDVIKRLPRYPSVPAVRIGRLAIDSAFQGRGLGAALLANAAKRTLEAPVAALALVVDAKNDDAVAFYRHYDFVRFTDRPRTLFLPIGTAARIFSLPRQR